VTNWKDGSDVLSCDNLGSLPPPSPAPAVFLLENRTVGRRGSARPRPSGAGGRGDRGAAAGEVEGRRPGAGEGAVWGRTSGVRAPRVSLPSLTGGRRIQSITCPQMDAQARSEV